MTTTSQAIKAYAEALPEGGTLSAKELLHLGERAAVDQALSRLVKRGELLRVRRGLFALPVKTRFGERAPSANTVVENIAKATGERVSISGAAAANILGLSTQNPACQVFWTSGPSRQLKLGAQAVELKHVPSWQLRAPNSRAGHAFRALAYFGQPEAREALNRIKPRLNEEERSELFELRANAPTWMAKELSALAAPNRAS
ncbi:hypothetical protein GTA62_19110 [Roseobacter sp. HKCCD9010]|uniref:DUF6088 family protein n=1 Tax=unclassified Roseobacter TaxID=196798 RepID=UPI0014917A51|nr:MULTISPECIES: DUF6088 family protein [unclassified Roseobacter]MBF9052141.1 hypothetical protein [Rhodobacterales bacterium HKCCD4356]NNV14061.1 hypothetical protein [Roseobacter sp. HKCCD7357]NNV18265.1 hypothetical protein [Roseobacter sp. HKCCD8768]NNV27760.1 hypothetical protein [Roseobacter sp. HKCCD8192]NNV32035.1 hypothetical protein [Roseobacter sp. HKCCD9061]